jgi:hypothetical protein
MPCCMRLPVMLMGLSSTACGSGLDRDLTVRLATDAGLAGQTYGFSNGFANETTSSYST